MFAWYALAEKWIKYERVCVCVRGSCTPCGYIVGNFAFVVCEKWFGLGVKGFSFNYINILWTAKLWNPFIPMTSFKLRNKNKRTKRKTKRTHKLLVEIDPIFHANNSCYVCGHILPLFARQKYTINYWFIVHVITIFNVALSFIVGSSLSMLDALSIGKLILNKFEYLLETIRSPNDWKANMKFRLICMQTSHFNTIAGGKSAANRTEVNATSW